MGNDKVHEANKGKHFDAGGGEAAPNNCGGESDGRGTWRDLLEGTFIGCWAKTFSRCCMTDEEL